MAAIAQLKLLVSLSQIDGVVGDGERKFLVNIGTANGFTEEEVTALIDQKHPLIIPSYLNEEQKFDYIFSLVQLMKIDEQMFREEILFCSKIASKLGYDSQVMFDLMLHVKSAAMGKNEVEELKNLTRKYLQ